MLAPQSPLRAAVTALAGAAVQTPVVPAPARPPNPPSASAKAAEEPIHSWAARCAWALLLVRIDEIFPLLCPNCGAELRIIAFICEAMAVPEILAHLGEPTSPPRWALTCGPPLWEMADTGHNPFDPQHSLRDDFGAVFMCRRHTGTQFPNNDWLSDSGIACGSGVGSMCSWSNRLWKWRWISYPHLCAAKSFSLLREVALKTISTQTISKIIGHVYDCAIDPSRWPEALAEINTTLGYLHAVLGVYARSESTPILHITAGLRSPWLEMWPQFVPSAAEYWGGHDRVMGFPLEEPVAASISVPADVASENAFCNRWMRPQHIVDLVAVTLVQEPRTFGSYVLARHESNGLATPSDLAIMRSLAPHVRRATEISRLFDPRPPEAAAYESLIESLASGVIFADAEGQIISVNRAARVMLENGDLARSKKGVWCWIQILPRKQWRMPWHGRAAMCWRSAPGA